MIVLTVYNTLTGENLGDITPIDSYMDIIEFKAFTKQTFIQFHIDCHVQNEKYSEYTIEDYVDYHNRRFHPKIDSVMCDVLRLSITDIKK